MYNLLPGAQKRHLVAPLPPNQLYRLAPLPQLQVIFRRLFHVHPSMLGIPKFRWTPSSARPSKWIFTFPVSSFSLLTEFVYGTSPFCPGGPRSVKRDGPATGICREDVVAKLRPPRHSRCLAKGALQSLLPSQWKGETSRLLLLLSSS